DVAIDIQVHDPREVEDLASSIRAIGGTVAISSIHINTWIGDYNKRSMSERVLTGMMLLTPKELRIKPNIGASFRESPT
ncbi:hydrolase, partial [Rhizobium leguminosarum]